MTAWLIILCLLLSTGAVAEVGSELVLSEDLLAFKNELTGEVVRIGMTMEEVGAIAGTAYYVRHMPLMGMTLCYESGLVVSYRSDRVAIGMTVIPMLLDPTYEMDRRVFADKKIWKEDKAA